MNLFLKRIKNRDALILFILIIMHTVVLFMLCNYPKSLETYRDELFYYDMAKSIYDGTGYEVHGAPYTFTAIGYSLLLVPFFAITNTLIRIKAIVFFNSLLSSLALIPAFLICRELKVSKRYIWLILTILMFWADGNNADTFMSENLYYMLTMVVFYFIIREINTDRIVYAIGAGILTYVAYLCKVIALAIPLAYAATVGICFIWNLVKKKENIKKQVRPLSNLILYVLVFVLLNIIVSHILFPTSTMSYEGAVERGISTVFEGASSSQGEVNESSKIETSSLDDGSSKPAGEVDTNVETNERSLNESNGNFMYFLYAISYYGLVTLLGFGVITVVRPIFRFNSVSKIARKTFLFSILLLIGSIIVIVTTVTMYEDLGSLVPRIHTRYVGSYFGLFLPILFLTYESRNNNVRPIIAEIILYTGLAIIFISQFKGIAEGSVVENKASRLLMTLPNYLQSPRVLSTVIVIAILSLFIVANRVGSRNNRWKPLFAGSCILLFCMVNSIMNYYNVKSVYSRKNQEIIDMCSINNYLAQNNGQDKRVLYLSRDIFDPKSTIYDTYLDAAEKEYSVHQGNFIYYLNTIEEKEINVSEIEGIREALWLSEYKFDTINYIITDYPDDEVTSVLDNIKLVPNLGGNSYRIYENINTAKFVLKR